MNLLTDRLLLRDFSEHDWRAVHAYQSNPLYLRFYPWEQRAEADVRRFVQMFLAHQRERPRTRFQLAVVRQGEDRPIGSCGVRVNNPEACEANLGYEIDPLYWNRGYATEAARTMLTFGFADLGMQRIWARCVAENTGSARVLEKIGMRLEGHEREKELIKGRWRDNLLYAILDHEWRGHHGGS